MTTLAPIDPLEMTEMIAALATYSGPAYVRMGKGGEAVVTQHGFEIGPARQLREGNDGLLITTGAVGHECLEAADELAPQGIRVQVLHVPTIAPLDTSVLMRSIYEHAHVLVVEEHLPFGGLWTAIVESMMHSGLHKRVHQAALPNHYADRYGSQREHWSRAGIGARQIAEQIRNMVGEKLHG
jgi:transketolase